MSGCARSPRRFFPSAPVNAYGASERASCRRGDGTERENAAEGEEVGVAVGAALEGGGGGALSEGLLLYGGGRRAPPTTEWG